MCSVLRVLVSVSGDLQVRHPRPVPRHRAAVDDRQLAARVRAVERHERRHLPRRHVFAQHDPAVRHVLQGRARPPPARPLQVPRARHHLRDDHRRLRDPVADRVARMRHRRGAPTQEPEVQAHRRPALVRARAQGAADGDAAAEQRRGALQSAQLPRTAPVRVTGGVHGGLRPARDRHASAAPQSRKSAM